jgi:hypothetical protein
MLSTTTYSGHDDIPPIHVQRWDFWIRIGTQLEAIIMQLDMSDAHSPGRSIFVVAPNDLGSAQFAPFEIGRLDHVPCTAA